MAPVVQKDVPVFGEWIGTLDGFVNAEIRPQIEGYLLKMVYREGSVVRAGDTLTTRWAVTAKADKPKHKGGIIEMTGNATNQRGEVAVECEGKILVASVPA